jgi:hypothetical protein
MRHVTISMEDKLLREVELAAADAGLSLSDYISGKLAASAKLEPAPDELAQRKLELLQKAFDGPSWDILLDGRMPDSDERNAR